MCKLGETVSSSQPQMRQGRYDFSHQSRKPLKAYRNTFHLNGSPLCILPSSNFVHSYVHKIRTSKKPSKITCSVHKPSMSSTGSTSISLTTWQEAILVFPSTMFSLLCKLFSISRSIITGTEIEILWMPVLISIVWNQDDKLFDPSYLRLSNEIKRACGFLLIPSYYKCAPCNISVWLHFLHHCQ